MMKNALTMFMYFFLMTACGTLAAAFIFMICCNLTLLVCGESFAFFNWDFYIRGLLISLPLVCVIVLALMIVYGLRHKKNPVIRLAVYVVSGLIVWLILIPSSFTLLHKYEEKYAKTYEVPFLSPGFFRPESGGVFYFSRVQEDGKADGLYIDLTGITGEKGSVVRFSNSIIDADFSGQFADSIIRDAVKLPFVILAPLELYSVLRDKAQDAWNDSFAHWLLFLCLALALGSCIAFENFSAWSLIDALAAFFTGLLICVVNWAYYKGYLFSSVTGKWNELIGDTPVTGGFFNSIIHSPDLFISFVNFIIFVLLTLTGILLFIFKSKTETEDELV